MREKKTDLRNTVDFGRGVNLCQQLNAKHFENESTEKKQQKKQT